MTDAACSQLQRPVSRCTPESLGTGSSFVEQASCGWCALPHRSQVLREKPSSLESTSVTERRCSLCGVFAVLTAAPLPEAWCRAPGGTLSFQLPPITALIRSPASPWGIRGGLMPTLSGPRQGHSSRGGAAAGARGRGTRRGGGCEGLWDRTAAAPHVLNRGGCVKWVGNGEAVPGD